MKENDIVNSSNLATPTKENRLRGDSKAVFSDFSPTANKNGSKMAAKTAKYFDQNIRMADLPKSIPIHPSQPRFVDSPTQPLIIYYIWNIDKKQFVRKRIIIPKEVQRSKLLDYANKVIKQKTAEIKAGYVAFDKKQTAEKITKEVAEQQRLSNNELTINEAFNHYLKRKAMSLSASSIKAYSGYLKWFMNHCIAKEVWNNSIKNFSFKQATKFFDEMYVNEAIGAKTHNEIVSFVKTVFQYYVKKKVIAENPCLYELKIVESEESHHPLTLEQIALMKDYILNVVQDEQLWLFLNFCFYTFARPRLELRLLKVKHILTDTILITSGNSKKNKNRHIVIHDALEKLIDKLKIRKYPPNYYVFSLLKEPGEITTGKNYFYKKNKSALIACGLTDKEYDLYAWKHTGNIQAYLNGTSIYDLKEQNGHQSIQQTEQYLRKIGAISPQDKGKLKHPTI